MSLHIIYIYIVKLCQKKQNAYFLFIFILKQQSRKFIHFKVCLFRYTGSDFFFPAFFFFFLLPTSNIDTYIYILNSIYIYISYVLQVRMSEEDRIRTIRSHLDQNRLLELANLYEEDEEYSDEHKLEIVEYYNNLQALLINPEWKNVSPMYQFGLEEDAAEIFQYRMQNNQVKTEKEAIEQSFDELVTHIHLITLLMHNNGWYDMYQTRDDRTQPVIDGNVVELGNIRKTLNRLYHSCYFNKMVLYYSVEGKKTLEEQLFDRIPMFTENQSIMDQFNLMNATRDSNLTNVQRVKHHVATNMLMERIKIRGYELFEPKVIPHCRVVYMEENGETHPVCSVCQRGKHLHKMPPEHNDVRQWENHVFRPLLEVSDGYRINTQAYVKIDGEKYYKSTIESYINEKCKHGTIHSALTKNGAACNKAVVDYFVKNRSDPQVQHAKLNRHAFSFQNGILYIDDHPKFFPYICDNREGCAGEICTCKAGKAPKHLISTAYFEKEWCDWRSIQNELLGAPSEVGGSRRTPPFANMELNTKPRLNEYGRHICENCDAAHVGTSTCGNFRGAMDVVCMTCGRLQEEHDNDGCEVFFPWRLKYMAYMHIKTPYLDKLFIDQGHTDETTRAWMYLLLIGRSLFKTNEKDKWQVFNNVLGKGGTGKSMLLEVIQMLFERQDIAILNNNAQDKFVEGDLINKRIILGPEVDNKLHRSFGRTALCAFAAGDWVCATVKGDKSVTAKQEAHILLVSNTPIYEFQDEAGSIHRRKVVTEFPNHIPHTDGLYKERLKSELGAIIVKCAGLYLDVANRHGTKKFWDVCPDYFRSVRERSRMRTNMIEMCIREKHGLAFNPDAYISVNDFVAKVKDFSLSIMSQRAQLQPWEVDRITSAFSHQNRTVRIETGEKPRPENNSRTLSTKWLVGVGDSEYFQDNDGESNHVYQCNNSDNQEESETLRTLKTFLNTQQQVQVDDDRTLSSLLDLVVEKYSNYKSLDDFINQPQPYEGSMY